MNKIIFKEDVLNYKPNDSFIAVISSNVKTKEELLIELHKKLLFPSYFGFNWDALNDCLRDFHWIEKKRIILIHDKIPMLDQSTLKTYIQIINEASQDWKEGEKHCFEVIFPIESKSEIRQICQS